MPHVTADRVRETSTTTGIGSYALAGASPNFRAFSGVCANSDTAHYAAVDINGAGWEVGLGTWSTGNTLARTTILASSNGGAAVNWSAGTRDIFITAPAAFIASRAASGANSDITGLTGLTAGSAAAPSIAPTGDSNTGIFFPAADTIAFSEGGVEAMRLDASGNVGIGTSGPTAPLTVKTRSVDNLALRVLENAGSGIIQFTDDPVTAERGRLQATSTGNVRLYGASTAEIYTAGSERMRIDTSGNVGIGTSAPSGALSVYRATGTALWSFQAVNNVVTAGSGFWQRTNGQHELVLRDTSNNANFITNSSNSLELVVNGSERMRINATGVVNFASMPTVNNVPVFAGPAFRARLSSNQTVTNGVDTKVTLNSEIFDTANCFDPVTNYRFTPNVAGYYQFNVTQGASAASALSFNYLQIRKNGISDAIALYGPYQNVASYGSLSALIYLNGTTDYVELYAQLAGSGTLQVVGGNTAVSTYMSGFLARAA